MDKTQRRWHKTVFRLRGLPETLSTAAEVAATLSNSLGDVAADDIRVFSLATSLIYWESPRTKVATLIFQSTPALLHRSAGQEEWTIQSAHGLCNAHGNLILDTHFVGMTPLNDVDVSNHSSDCIAISGLSSHAFGSWQPKGDDKSFMWIRDGLPNHMRNTRAILYGYDSRLVSSRSFQSIPDLALALIQSLSTCGWDKSWAKSIVFLAHSLGGLVLQETLVKLADASGNELYGCLLRIIKGAVFFGVPNLGMEQAHFRRVVQNNPNETLVDDLRRGSNYLQGLEKDFNQNLLNKNIQYLWGYETMESPTLERLADGTIDRNGRPAILVSRESATRRHIETNTPIVFPIHATHSDMVKFKRDSPDYHMVISKLTNILSTAPSGPPGDADSLEAAPIAPGGKFTTVSSAPMHGCIQLHLNGLMESFIRDSELTDDEEHSFKAASLNKLQDIICALQDDHERRGALIYMRRLEPFLTSMGQYCQVANDLTDSESSDVAAFIWGPMTYILQLSSTLPEAVHAILDAYQYIGEQIPALRDASQLLSSKPYLQEVLVILYGDVLDFQRQVIMHLKQRYWKQLFKTSWRGAFLKLEFLKNNIARSCRMIEAQVTITEFEEILNRRAEAIRAFERDELAQHNYSYGVVKEWLSFFDCEPEQDRHRSTRSIVSDSGRWLLEHTLFKQWFSPEYCSIPLLWLNGIPGAGKTVLASVVIDAVRAVEGAHVLFFYCRHAETDRNSFMGVARSLLAQILSQKRHLLSYFTEKASLSSALTSPTVAKEMMRTAFNSCQMIYIIIDGLDECTREGRKEICACFRDMVDNLPPADSYPVRCLFVSQDDGIARKDLGQLSTIKIAEETQPDLRGFAAQWHKKIEAKFGKLRSPEHHIANILVARSQGMFIFAELFAKYLEDQPHRAALLAELHPATMPHFSLSHVYSRIMDRVTESRSEDLLGYVREVLGWLVCAKRPLRWREIQGAICIDLDREQVDYDRKLLDSPKGLFASLVELRDDETVELVHSTARRHLIDTGFVKPREADYSLALLSLSYLSLAQMDRERSEEHIRQDLVNGTYAFYDYASACWALHMQSGVPKEDADDTRLPVPKKIEEALLLLKASESYDQIVQAIVWSRKQMGLNGQGPDPDEATDLWQVTQKLRSSLEAMCSTSQPAAESQALRQLYGQKIFKCCRVSCYYYHEGFKAANQRDAHIQRHERPFFCFVDGCHRVTFGCTTKEDLQKHLFEYHGIDQFEGIEFPDPPKPKQATQAAKNPGKFQCSLCEKKFTARHNLNAHLRWHEGEKPYVCSTCPERFTRKSDRDRHEQRHGEENKYLCSGTLKGGSTWGCKRAFSRAEKLADHLHKSKRGQNCIKPLLLEKLREGAELRDEENFLSGQLDSNADALLEAGKYLPSFADFLKECGLEKSIIGKQG